eukprot:5986674-Pyramimonas_sp.AAC.1
MLIGALDQALVRLASLGEGSSYSDLKQSAIRIGIVCIAYPIQTVRVGGAHTCLTCKLEGGYFRPSTATWTSEVKKCEAEGVPVEQLDGRKAGMESGAYLTKSEEDLKKYKLMASLKVGFALDLLKRQVRTRLVLFTQHLVKAAYV